MTTQINVSTAQVFPSVKAAVAVYSKAAKARKRHPVLVQVKPGEVHMVCRKSSRALLAKRGAKNVTPE